MRAVEMEDLTAILEEQRAGKVKAPIGEILVARGLIRAEDLDSALHYQLVEEILEIFYWREISYEFFAEDPEKTLAENDRRLTRIAGDQNAGEILLHVTKIIDDIEKFNQTTPSMKDVYELTRDVDDYVEEVGLPEHIAELLPLIDGDKDMGEVLKEMRLNRLEAMEVFFRLKTDGMIRAKNSFELLMLAENRRNSFSASKRVRLYERATELGVDGFEIAFRTAQTYEELGRKAEAAEHYFTHSKGMERQLNLKAAVAATGRALALCPDRTDIRKYRAEILTKLEMDEAVAEEYLEIARIHKARFEFEEAEAALVKALETAPENEDLPLARIDVLVESGATRRAAQACLELARDRQEDANHDGALEMLRLAVGIERTSLRFRNALVKLLTEIGEKDAAAEAIGEMVPVVLERTEDRKKRAFSILKHLESRLEGLDARSSTAMSTIAEALLGLGKKSAGLRVLVETGEARIAEGKIADAHAAYLRAVEISPHDLDLAETLALLQARLGAKEHALARLRSIAGMFRKREKLDRAERAYKEMLRLDPFSPDALLELARLKADQGQKKAAAAQLFQIGHLYKTAGNLEDAVTYFDEACRYDPGNTAYVRELAEVLGKALKTEESLDSFDALLAMLRARSDHTGVIDVAMRILEIDPDNEDATQALSESYRSLGRKVKSVAGPAKQQAAN